MRRTRIFVAFLAVVCCASAARAGKLHGYVFLFPVESEFRSVGFAEYLNDLNNRDSAVLSGTHSVRGPSSFQTPVQGDGLYDYTLAGPAEPSACYGTSLFVVANPAGLFNTTSGSWTGDTRCAPPPPPPPPPPDPSQISNCDWQGCYTPIVLNMGNGNYELTGVQDPVTFDIDGDGRPNRLSWTAPGAPMAFLALDRNANGRIDNGTELFGNHTPLQNGTIARNGFEALKAYDSNHDGLINAADPIWTQLLLWIDRNHNGISEPEELSSIATSSVRAIGTDYHWTGRRDQYGNIFGYAGDASIGNRLKPVYDIFFIPVN